MRYSLARGYQSNQENANGYYYCLEKDEISNAVRDIREEVRDAMDLLMNSSGHRKTILSKSHRKVNIGLAWDGYHLFTYQQFEGDYVEFDTLPVIEGNELYFEGITKNGASFHDDDDLQVQIYYDPPPYRLTRGQLAESGCSTYDPPIAALRKPLNEGWSYDSDTTFGTALTCQNPYEFSPDTEAPSSPLFRKFSPPPTPRFYKLKWITASQWMAKDRKFSVRADISELLKENGNGVYSIVIWSEMDEGSISVSQYSIFYGITPPDTYTLR